MSPLQKIAMGLVLMVAPSSFLIGGYVWDLLPDPLGWLLVISGVRALRGHLDVEALLWTAWIAFAVSIPQWIPPLFKLLLPPHDPTGDASIRWAFFVPQALFMLLLARAISREATLQKPRDVFVAGRYGVLIYAAGALIILPPIAYGTANVNLRNTAFIAIGLVPWFFVYQLFRVHRRTWLGGPGPLEVPAYRPPPPPETQEPL